MSSTILEHILQPKGELSKDDRLSFEHLVIPISQEDSAIDDFCVYFFDYLTKYDGADRSIRTKKVQSFPM